MSIFIFNEAADVVEVLDALGEVGVEATTIPASKCPLLREMRRGEKLKTQVSTVVKSNDNNN